MSLRRKSLEKLMTNVLFVAMKSYTMAMKVFIFSTCWRFTDSSILVSIDVEYWSKKFIACQKMCLKPNIFLSKTVLPLLTLGMKYSLPALVKS